MDMTPRKVSEMSASVRRLFAVMFCAGLYAMLAQILLLRELLTAFYGNELTIGAMLSVWLIMIGVGSLMVQPLLHRMALSHLWRGMAVLLLLLAAVLPAQVWVIRIIRIILHVPYGEYVPFAAMLTGAGLALLPTGLSVGILFPCACHLAHLQQLALNESMRGHRADLGLNPPPTPPRRGLKNSGYSPERVVPTPSGRGGLADYSVQFLRTLAHGDSEQATGRLYAVESLGSLVGGVLFTFVFVQWLTPFAIMAFAGLVAVCGAMLATPSRLARYVLIGPLLGLAVAAACPHCIAGLERKSLEARWQAFGALGDAVSAAEGSSPRLVASVDSRYQNLALIDSYGQTTFYGNGMVLGVFPDQIIGEHKVHFIMAQNPAAQSVLFIGGNPVTDIPELLKYPLRRLVHVELDGEISRLLERAGGREYRQAIRDPRFSQAVADGPRFVKTSSETFDVIIVDAPEPTTIALNRFYTLDFYQAVQRRLAAGGFMYTAVEASEDLQEDAAALSASVRQSLKRVFPRILITAGTRNQYFVGMDDSPLTFDRQILFQRSADAGLRHRYFRPEYFLNADEISPAKTEFVERRLAGVSAPINTALQPISTYYQLRLWSLFSGSRLEGFLAGLGSVRFGRICAAIGIAGLLLFIVGIGMGVCRRCARHGCRMLGKRCFLSSWNVLSLTRSDRLKNVLRTRRLPDATPQIEACSPGPGTTLTFQPGGAIRRRWARGMLGLVLASTGCCGMALELILVYVFQSLLGYVYARIGLIVAMFMLGLMLGALLAARRTPVAAGTWWALLGLDILLLSLAACVPFLAKACLHSGALFASDAWVEILINGAILLVGWAVGAQFVVVVRLLVAAGVTRGAAAAQANAADLFGAAFGGFAVGVVLLPIWGVQTACILLITLKGASLLLALSARLALGQAEAEPTTAKPLHLPERQDEAHYS